MTLAGGKFIPYYLDESKGWGLDPDALTDVVAKAKAEGTNIRAMCVINPGNPSGAVLKQHDLNSIIRICHENSILIMSDEVYQQNIYKDSGKFVSMRRALHEIGEPFASEVELVSMHSVSKGLLGECGLRGGYIEAHNFPQDAL